MIRTIESFFSNHQMIVAGYANGYGLAPGDIRKDERALREATALGERLGEPIGNLRKNEPVIDAPGMKSKTQDAT